MNTNDVGNHDPLGLLGGEETSSRDGENPWRAIKHAEMMFPHTCTMCGCVFDNAEELTDPEKHTRGTRNRR